MDSLNLSIRTMDSFESVLGAASQGLSVGETLQSLPTKLSVELLSHPSPEVEIHPSDSASRSIVKARGQDNRFSALES
jgi:hypothetical protein